MEELREYGRLGGQVFVSTHSPDIMNYVEIEEAFQLEKNSGKTQIKAIKNNRQVAALVAGGDKLGWLWNQNLLTID